MRKAMAFFLVMILAASVSAYIDDDLLYASQAKLNLTINSSFEIQKLSSSYNIDHVSVKVSYIPLESYRQRVVSHTTFPTAKENGDNIVYTWEDPSIGTKELRSTYIMTTSTAFYPIREKVIFPLQNIPKDTIRFTKETSLIDSNDDIERLANEIAQGNDDLYQIVFDAAKWVNYNIEYDLSTVTSQASLPSSWVLKERKGVCDEMTNLFISIIRSLGIPARFVSGISYTNSPLFEERWGPHGWAEVYFPGQGWVPFDPTYGQYGFVDSGHIKLKESVDSDKSIIDYEWLSYGVDIVGKSPDNKITILEKIGIYDPGIEIEMDVLNDPVGFGSYNVIIANIRNNADAYRPLKFSLVAPEETVIETNEKFVLLKPGESKEVLWKVRFPDDLSRRSIYTFPFTAVSSMNNSQNKDVTVRFSSPSLDESYVDSYIESKEISNSNVLDADFNCDHRKSIDADKKLQITCVYEDKSLQLCLEDECKTSLSGQVGFSKSYPEPGAYPLIIIASKGEEKKSYYSQVIVNDKPNITLEWQEFNTTIFYSDSQNIVFHLKQESISVPADAKIFLTYNHLTRMLEIEDFGETQLFQFKLKGSELDTGMNSIDVRIEYLDESGNMYQKDFSKSISMETDSAFQTIIAKVNSFLNYLTSKIENAVY